MTRSQLIVKLVGWLILASTAYYFYSLFGSQNQKADISAPIANKQIIDKQAALDDPKIQVWKEQFRSDKPMKRVVDLYKSESKRIGAVDPDPESTQKRLEVFAAELNSEEMVWLKKQSLDPKSEGDARFFAVFLLALNPNSMGQLKEIASTKIPKNKNQGIVELERQIRAQAIEGISRKCGDKLAEEAILDVMEKQNDEFLQDRGHRSLYAWRTCKPIEEQDKDALSRLQYGK